MGKRAASVCSKILYTVDTAIHIICFHADVHIILTKAMCLRECTLFSSSSVACWCRGTSITIRQRVQELQNMGGK